MISHKGKEYMCKMEVTLSYIGGKWKVLILWYLSNQTMRFSELKRSLPSITQKMLTSQLRELEQDGLVERIVYPQIPPKVEYRLTELGNSLVPILSMMCDWAADNLEWTEEEDA